ncbi:hypothetical protein [Acidithiobacillus thiooxidans]|jgi:hypothetical protein|uniref:hypothetical protein n=1 Tax=Acidithiobacillus thiooxidans TaxID=930 RepID=UPI0009D92DA0|nr:hypothetical protein [Acidithiobacillus thiooxidans]
MKNFLKNSRYIFFMVLIAMTYNLQQINSIGWGGWVLYATTAVFTLVANNMAGGITLKESKTLDDLVTNVADAIKLSNLAKNVADVFKPTPPQKRHNKPTIFNRKGRKARKSKGAKP